MEDTKASDKASPPARQAARKAVQDLLDLFHYLMQRSSYNGYDARLMKELVLIDAGPDGLVEYELHISDFYANMNGVMHGGAAGVIFDMCTTTALCPIQRPGYWDFQGGVTRSLSISYLKAIPIGTTVRIRCAVIQHGRLMALIRGSLESVDGKVVYATCDHHKVHTQPLPEHLKVRDEMRKAVAAARESKAKL